MGLEKWLSGQERFLLGQKTQIHSSVPIWQHMPACNSCSRGPLLTPLAYTHMHINSTRHTSTPKKEGRTGGWKSTFFKLHFIKIYQN